MTGMTPAWLTFNGRYVDVPPYMRRPIMRFAYCTGMRRCACSTNTMAAMMTAPTTITIKKMNRPLVCRMLLSSAGKRAAIWVKIRIDMPLPMPRSVMSSPSHMMIAVPAVIVRTMVRITGQPSFGMIGVVQPVKI